MNDLHALGSWPQTGNAYPLGRPIKGRFMTTCARTIVKAPSFANLHINNGYSRQLTKLIKKYNLKVMLVLPNNEKWSWMISLNNTTGNIMSSISTLSSILKFLAGALLLFGVGWWAVATYNYETKITDPSDPRFDPMKFSFRDYTKKRGNEWDLPAALLKMSPPGTDKAYVEKILIDVADAEMQKYSEHRNYYIFHWPSFKAMEGSVVNIQYSNKNKSDTLYLGGNRLYESRSYKTSLRPDVREYIETQEQKMTDGDKFLEEKMRPIRKKYLGDSGESGFLK